jgi:uncharacterized protein
VTAAERPPLSAVQESLFIWAASFTAILLAFAAAPPYAKLVATVSFLYLPVWAMNRRGEEYADYGVTTRRWRADVKLFLLFAAIVTPLFIGGFLVFFHLLPHLPADLRHALSPIQGMPHFRPRLPPRFMEWVLDQLLVVALPEELFYRGFVQTRLRDAWPQGRMLFGGRLGPAFWLTAVLFALGHLAVFQVWRLGVFFPALLFGWMRERTGTVLGAALFHAYCNLLELTLESSFF